MAAAQQPCGRFRETTLSSTRYCLSSGHRFEQASLQNRHLPGYQQPQRSPDRTSPASPLDLAGLESDDGDAQTAGVVGGD